MKREVYQIVPSSFHEGGRCQGRPLRFGYRNGKWQFLTEFQQVKVVAAVHQAEIHDPLSGIRRPIESDHCRASRVESASSRSVAETLEQCLGGIDALGVPRAAPTGLRECLTDAPRPGRPRIISPVISRADHSDLGDRLRKTRTLPAAHHALDGQRTSGGGYQTRHRVKHLGITGRSVSPTGGLAAASPEDVD